MTESNPLARYLVPLRRWWPVVAAAVAVGVGVAWITLPDSPDPAGPGEQQIDPEIAYRASHILVRGQSSVATENFDLVMMLARQGEIAGNVADALGDQVEPGAVESTEVQADADLGTLTITAVQPTAERAALVATTYAEEIARYFDAKAQEAVDEQLARATERLASIDDRIQTLNEQSTEHAAESLEGRLIEAELTVLVDQYGQLQAELRDLSTRDLGGASTFETLEASTPVPTSTEVSVFEVPQSSGSRFGLAAFIAAMLGVGLVIVIDRVDSRIRTRDDAEAAFGLPVLAEVPRRFPWERKSDPLPVRSEPGSHVAESFRGLRLAVQFTSRWRLQREAPTRDGASAGAAPVSGSSVRTLLVTSAWTGEGKSTVVANLAASIAEAGQRVLVVDCDFRHSTVHELLEVDGGRGLHELSDPGLMDSLDELAERIVQPTVVPGVSLVRAGTAGSAPTWFLPISGQLVEMAKDVADVVLFDTGPLLVTNEAAALTPFVDAVLVVARSGRTSREQARRTTEQLTRLRAMVAGVVLVASRGHRAASGYYEPLRRAVATRVALRR